MAATRRPGGVGSELDEALVRAGRHLRRGVVSADMRTLEKPGGREADRFYRDRWSYDKVVRSTHGVNCTGSCSWKVYVKDGIITWESQQTDYPSAGPDRPDYEPRGCPRGAAFSWYTYSPTRVRYPYVRGVLLEMFRAAKARHGGDPVRAWAEITGDPDLAGRYKSARGKGGFVRATWDEAVELAAAAHVHTIRTWGPDRIAGFSPIPAMSMVSHAAGARFHALIGAPLLSFYDWYADLPVASPQVFGDQTDVPESGDWWDAAYLVLWGSNVPVTRTPDADASQPCTPAWQETITGVPAAAAERIGREFAQNAEDSGGRSMIIMGAGTNHYFHSDTIYRAFLALVTLTGCQGRNGGGWAHYVGQEKVRPITGHATLAMATDWQRPPRQMIGTAYWYLATDQWRYDTFTADAFAAPAGRSAFAGLTTADLIAQSARLGWMPSYPTFNWNPLDLADAVARAGEEPGAFVAGELAAGRLRFAAEDPDAPENYPRVLTVWRANLLGSSGKGNEYFLKHLLGADSSVRASEAPQGQRPRDVVWREQAADGKLDLLLALDFRMTSTTLFADVVLPAATWYEKHDLSSTDMHPFVHAFSPAISPPWQTRTDFDAFHALARAFSDLAATHLGSRHDLVAVPLQHDTPDEMAVPGGTVRDWRADGRTPVPGRDFPKLVVVERDYPNVAAKMAALGPLPERLGLTTKGTTFDPSRAVEFLKHKNGTVRGGVADGRPRLDRDVHACEAILALSGTTNGQLAVSGFRALERRTGTVLADLAAEHEGKQITFTDTQARPTPVITSPEWSGSETGGRRYSAFVINVERSKPWHTLTGRQHFFLDHDWMAELGEQMPVFRPPLDMHALFGEPRAGQTGALGVTVRYLTPHSKWSIHSEYQDNLFMLSLSRGGPTIWMSPHDAEKAGIADNDWVEAVNRNGVVVARAIVSHRMPAGTVYMYHAQERVIDVATGNGDEIDDDRVAGASRQQVDDRGDPPASGERWPRIVTGQAAAPRQVEAGLRAHWHDGMRGGAAAPAAEQRSPAGAHTGDGGIDGYRRGKPVFAVELAGDRGFGHDLDRGMQDAGAKDCPADGRLTEVEVTGERPGVAIHVDGQRPAQRCPQRMPADGEKSSHRVGDLIHRQSPPWPFRPRRPRAYRSGTGGVWRYKARATVMPAPAVSIRVFRDSPSRPDLVTAWSAAMGPAVWAPSRSSGV
jgi:nitrate reductase alpha subunit